MNAVGIDVSKGKSTVAIMQPLGVVVKTPYAAYKRLPLEGKLSAARLTDEVAGGLPCCFAPHNNSVLLRKIVVEPGYNHLKGYEIGVTIAVTPILSLGFCGAKSDARYNCGQ